MSLNKFVDTNQKSWLNIGCDEIVCNQLTIDGQKIIPNPIVFTTTTGLFSSSIYPSPVTILSTLNVGLGSLTTFGFSAGDQLRITTSCIINSPTAVNNVKISLLPMAGTQIQIPYAAYTTNTNIVIESNYTFVTAEQAYFVSTVYLPTDIQVVNYGLPIDFPAIVPYDLSLSAVSTAACTLTHVQTTITLI